MDYSITALITLRHLAIPFAKSGFEAKRWRRLCPQDFRLQMSKSLLNGSFCPEFFVCGGERILSLRLARIPWRY